MPLDVTKAPGSASPLWIIALFIALSEATAGVAAISTNGAARLIFSCFAVAFPTLVFVVFVWLLISHAANLYAPGQYSSDITPEIYRTGISRTDSIVLARAVARAVVPALGHNTEGEDSTEALNQVARRFEEAVEESSVLVTLSPLLNTRAEVLQIPVTEETSIRLLLDAIYWAIQPRVEPFTYGKTWLLYDRVGGKGYDEMGTRWAERANLLDDIRPISSVGIGPGSRLIAGGIVDNIKSDGKTKFPLNTVTFRHGITDGYLSVEVAEGETVRQVAERSGLVMAGSIFNVRDKSDCVVDNEPGVKYVGSLLSIEVTI
jgi:hypothetical protein